jgi:hypothetical protein
LPADDIIHYALEDLENDWAEAEFIAQERDFNDTSLLGPYDYPGYDFDDVAQQLVLEKRCYSVEFHVLSPMAIDRATTVFRSCLVAPSQAGSISSKPRPVVMSKNNPGVAPESSTTRKRRLGRDADVDERPAKINLDETGNDSDGSTVPKSVPVVAEQQQDSHRTVL